MNVIERALSRLFTVNLKTRLVLGFLIATCLTGVVATLVGIRIINKTTVDEAQNKVSENINTARLIYNYNLERLAAQIQFIVVTSHLHRAIVTKDIRAMENLRRVIRFGYVPEMSGRQPYLDMLTVADAAGTVIYRTANPEASGDSLLWDPVVKRCIEKRSPQSATQLLSLARIERENPRLSDRVRIPIVRTPMSFEIRETFLSEGMVLRAAYPILDENQQLLGILEGGILLNGDYGIVDEIKGTVYHDEKYAGRDMGVATIFQRGVRISTNVMTESNRRAIGTPVSKEVYEKVLGRGEDWIGRAFVVNDWYITTYSPIRDIDNEIIGILYTGILEAKYTDIKRRTLWTFLVVTLAGMVVAFGISYYLGNTILRRIRILKKAAEAISSGNLDYRLTQDQYSGFGMLDEAFNNMTLSLRDRDERLQKAFQRLTASERMAALGQMAAGVAHEINNPLGGILLYSNLVLEDLPEGHPARQNLEKIIYQTNRSKRIVQNLLDFARTPAGNATPLSIREVIMSAINLVKDQSMFLGIEIDMRMTEDLPPVLGDYSRLEEVFLNLFVNAADAMAGKGTLRITTRLNTVNTVRIGISDTGKGIERSYLQHIFEPFFTTKEPGQGTGLGLSIAYGIVREHNGTIDVESEPGRGTTFIITLPAYLGNAQERKEGA